MRFRRDRDHRVAGGERRGDERHKAKQRRLLGAGDPQDANRLVHGECHAADRDMVHGAVVLVRPRGIAEEAG